MLLIGELLPWSLFSKGRNLSDCACPALVIWGWWACSQGSGVTGDFPPHGVQENQPKPSGCFSRGNDAPCPCLPAPAHRCLSSGCGCAGDQLPHPLRSYITCLCRLCWQRRAGSLVRLVQALPCSLGKCFPCSRHGSGRALPATGPLGCRLLPFCCGKKHLLLNRKMKEHWGSCCRHPPPAASQLASGLCWWQRICSTRCGR